MKAETLRIGAVLLGVAFASTTASAASAADAGAPTAKTVDAGAAGSEGPADPHAGMNADAAGHAHGGDEGDDPHGHGGGAAPELPQDSAMENPLIDAGSIEALLVDPGGKPMANAEVTLGILYNSVAKGESRKRVVQTTDASGIARFSNLDVGSGVAYRVMALRDGATFSVMPFQLPAKGGMRAILHVYPVVSSIEETVVVSQTMLYAEVKDDRVQVQQAFKIYNLGNKAWVPKDYVIALPESFTAFGTQQGMTDIGVDAVAGKGAKIHGTFGPGQHVIEFRWQLPYAGESEVHIDVGMTPHLASAQVITPASKGMKLQVEGFPAPEAKLDGQGQRSLVTGRAMTRDEPAVTALHATISGLPTEGPGRILATLLAVGTIGLGIVLGTKKAQAPDRRAERAQLLADLEELEKAHQRGDVGPKTHERARRELVDAIARTFADDPPAKKRAG